MSLSKNFGEWFSAGLAACGTARTWHWVSSAMCLVGMLLFAVTGITLNHAGAIEAKPRIFTLEVDLPDEQMAVLQTAGTNGPVPDALRAWLFDNHRLRVPEKPAEWRHDELYLSLPRPGGDAWLSVDLGSGELLYESTDRGWIAYFNDLHKGRHTGTVWSWFLDIFALACVVFCVSGLILLQRYAGNRPSTWPLVGAGLVIPMLLVILFIH